MSTSGWILLHRKTVEHWLWQDPRAFHRWVTILFYVNHSASKFLVGNELFTCNPGSSYRSLEEWGRLFKTNKKQVKIFFDLLEKDAMIRCEILGKGNRRKHLLTVVNWGKYQNIGTGKIPETELERYPEQRKKKKGLKKPRPEKPADNYLDLIIEIFKGEYRNANGQPYIIVTPGKEKEYAGKIAGIFKDLYPGLKTDDALQKIKSFFHDACNIQDNWHRPRMSLTHAATNYNTLAALLTPKKNGQAEKQYKNLTHVENPR